MDGSLLTASQMRGWERTAMANGAASGTALMERAGEGIVEAILTAWPDLANGAHAAVVLCGPGNNGGDGFVVARLLHRRGWTITAQFHGDPDRLPPDARANYDAWAAVGSVSEFGRSIDAADKGIVVDALFGIGLSRPLDPDLRQRMDALATRLAGWRVVAVDVPSGLNADRGDGEVPLPADLTVTFQAPKLGHVLGDGPRLCGHLAVADIGLDALGAAPDGVPLVGAPAIAKMGGHKYDHGHALVLSGGFGRTGAARLAARAALRVGAGLATLGAPGSAMMECAEQLTAVMLARVEDGDALAQRLEDGRLNALCLGPGVGTDERAAGLVAAALQSGRACVLDADALTVIAGDGALRGGLHPGCVLTPHMGEFRRLCADLADQMDGKAEDDPWAKMRARRAAKTGAASPSGAVRISKVDAVRAAAARLGCTVLWKGPDTVIGAPDGRVSVHAAVYDRAAPWLATAGAGDVLAGLIAGLLARGRTPVDAACAAAWLHVEAARAAGPGMIAEDLPEVLPRVLAGVD